MEMKEIKVKFLGNDCCGRKVYKNILTGRYYKDPESLNYPGRLFTSDGFDGEPDCPLKEDLKITIIE